MSQQNCGYNPNIQKKQLNFYTMTMYNPRKILKNNSTENSTKKNKILRNKCKKEKSKTCTLKNAEDTSIN